MKMSINNLQSIILGREKDGGVKTIEIDCSEWKEKFPQLTKYRIEVTSPNGIIYCPEVTMNEYILTWPITKSDTALTGKGAYQIVATGENDERLTSAHLSLNIYSIMPGTAQETPPEYIESWIQNIVDTAERAELAAKKAEDAAAGIVITPEEIQNAVDNYLIENPIEVEETDPTVPDWAKEKKKPTYTAEEVGAQPKGDYALKSDIHAAPVQSVNGKTGTVVLKASDVGALPADTKIPEPYTLPIASPDTLGGVKVGKGLQMDGDALRVADGEEVIAHAIVEGSDTYIVQIDVDTHGEPFELSYAKIRYISPVNTGGSSSGSNVVFLNKLGGQTGTDRMLTLHYGIPPEGRELTAFGEIFSADDVVYGYAGTAYENNGTLTWIYSQTKNGRGITCFEIKGSLQRPFVSGTEIIITGERRGVRA